ncbi:MAG: flavodoxin domain-containing protein [Pseudomonadota bacterium]
MNILFGSVTGTAENVARDAARKARSRGHHVRICELDEITMDELMEMEDVLVVIATYGEGEMPFNAEMFWDELEAIEPPLDTLSYSVLALGDTAYKQFCQAGKDLDARFEELGATRRLERVDCDLNYERDAAAWIDKVIPQIEGAAPVEEPDDEGALGSVGRRYTRATPFSAEILENRLLSGDGSSKETRHYRISLEGSGLEYLPGDCVGVVPVNPPEMVADLLERLRASAEDTVEGYDLSLGQLLSTKFEINTAGDTLIRAVNSVIEDDDLAQACAGGRAGIEDYAWGRDVVDILSIDPRLEVDPETLLSLLPPLQHRTYSIASSAKASPGEMHLTVATLRWEREGRAHRGLCSTHLADTLGQGGRAEIFMVPNSRFRLPNLGSAQVIMVGPGTGIAPYLGFLQERQASGASGTNWLITGDRHSATDHVYARELAAFQEAGVLNRLDLAFSRDQAEKRYVQDVMRENGEELYGALERGAYFYLCGDAKRMAVDVEACLVELIDTYGTAKPENFLSDMRREGRYAKDVY